MHGDYIGEPHGDVGQVVGQDSLCFAAECLSFCLVHFHTNLIGERVDARIAVVSAIRAVWREALGRENELEDVRIVVGADPAEKGELKISADGIGEESGQLERTEFEIDAGFAPLFLKGGADKAGLFFCGDLEREMKADSVCCARVSGSVEDFFGAGSVSGIFRNVWFVRPMIWREDAAGNAGLAVKQKSYEGFAVSGESEGFADFAFGEEGILKIDAEIGEVGSRALAERE